MALVQQQESEKKQDALDWAYDHFPFDEQHLVTDRPWGKTFLLKNGNTAAYLKVLPQHQLNAAHTTPILGKLFGNNIPTSINGDSRRGFLLLRGHEGNNLSAKPSNKQKRNILKTYASIQTQAAISPTLLNSYTPIELDTVVPRFLEFLNPANSKPATDSTIVGIDFFIGSKEATTYYKLFTARADLLTTLVSKSKDLKNTINHLDLRPSNAAESNNGQCIIYDWEESVVGPAGLSLHAMFSGSYLPIVLLAAKQSILNPEELRSARILLKTYQETLIEGNYASKEELSVCLGGSICAGLIYFLTTFSLYPNNSKSYKETIAKNLKKRLSDLLNVCDFLTIQNQDQKIFEFVNQYRRNGRSQRAKVLIDQYLLSHPMDPLALQERGLLLMSQNNLASAINTFQQALDITPNNASLQLNIGSAYTKSVNYELALLHLRHSLNINPDNQSALSLLEHITALNRWYTLADRPGTVPQVDLTDEERIKQKLVEGKLELCSALFLKYGVLQLNNIFDPDLLLRAHTAFSEKYNQYMENKRHEDALRIGDKRFQVTLALEPPFDEEALIANQILLSMMQTFLGKNFTIGAFTSSMSLPGAKVQRLHKDHKALFADVEDLGRLPSFAVTIMIPLIAINETIGTTRVRKGSHILTTPESRKLPSQSPIVDLGSCYLMDYRLSHYGQANQSTMTRPIINMVYQRPWFRDYMNFNNQAPIQLSRQRFKDMPKSLKRLLAWTQEPSAHPTDSL